MPSESLEFIHKAINFVKTIRHIPEKDVPITCKTGNNNRQSSVKKSGNEEFDFPTECFDGVEVCEIVGAYILHLVRTVMRKENVGLCRDDRLGIQRNFSDPEIERKRK